MNCTLHQATEKDYAVLCELYAEGDVFHAEGEPEVFRRIAGPSRTQQEIRKALEEGVVLVAEREGQAVGLVHAQLVHTPDYPMMVPRTYVPIDSLAVKVGYRRQGVGMLLMQAAESWARELGIDTIELSVREFNREAIGLYEGLGYETASRRMWKRLR